MQYGKIDVSLKQSFLQATACRRRSARRCLHDMTAEIEMHGGTETCQCQVVDVSPHGLGCLGFEGSASLPEDATLIIWLTHAGDSLLPVLGKVVYRRNCGSFRHLGIELEPEGAEMVGIDALV